jgi:metallo-beta-lactamase family protein
MIVHHLKNNIQNAKTNVIFVGFQVEGTLGRKLVEQEPEVYIHGQKFDVKAKIHTLGGFSAHADQRDLRYWLRAFGHTPRRVFMVHGEEEVALQFADNIRTELRVDTHVPTLNEVVELE